MSGDGETLSSMMVLTAAGTATTEMAAWADGAMVPGAIAHVLEDAVRPVLGKQVHIQGEHNRLVERKQRLAPYTQWVVM